MRILVYPHAGDLGGSQLIAVDLAAGLAQRGHDVVVFAPDGPLSEVIRGHGLPIVASPRPRVRPSPTIIRSLCELVRLRGIDVVHAFEWPPTLDAVYGPFLMQHVPVVSTVMSMSVAPFIPAIVPLTVGTAEIARIEQKRRPVVELLEPPVDTALDRPGDRLEHRRTLGLTASDLVVVVVSRLARELKLEGILAAIEVAARLSHDIPLRLVIAGDGPCRLEVEQAAEAANQTAGRPVVMLTGNLMDPRPLYQSADVALGMGGSILRAMAFGIPAVVQGERGFWRVLDELTAPTFFHQGWYGVGSNEDGPSVLIDILRDLLTDVDRRRRLGAFARSTVVARYSLEGAARAQEKMYQRAITSVSTRRRAVPLLLAPFATGLAYDLRRKIASRWTGVAADDFNALPAVPAAHTGGTGS